MNDKEAEFLPAMNVSMEKPGKRGDPLNTLLVHADSDYVAARVLFACGLDSGTLLHSHQAVEKYLKAFLHSKQGSWPFTHELKELCADAARLDGYFSEPRVRLTCENLSLVYDWSRYPEQKLAGFGLAWQEFIDFVDEFAYTTRCKIPFPENCRNLLNNISEGIKESWPFGSFEFVAQSFLAENRYFAPKSTQKEAPND